MLLRPRLALHASVARRRGNPPNARIWVVGARAKIGLGGNPRVPRICVNWAEKGAESGKMGGFLPNRPVFEMQRLAAFKRKQRHPSAKSSTTSALRVAASRGDSRNYYYCWREGVDVIQTSKWTRRNRGKENMSTKVNGKKRTRSNVSKPVPGLCLTSKLCKGSSVSLSFVN